MRVAVGIRVSADVGREAAGMLRRVPLARVSPKRRDMQSLYERAVQTAYLRDKGQCQAAADWPEVECGGRAQVHHIAPVGRFPELRCEVSNLKTLCAVHHFHVHHVNPIRARELGVLR